MLHAKAVNHIGIAVRDIAAHRPFYEDVLGARFDGIEEVADQGVRVAFFLVGAPGHEVRLELLEPLHDASPVAKHIAQRGEGLHHVAYTVDDIDARLAALKAADVRLVDDTPRAGAHHTRIAFLHPKASGSVLTELCQPAPTEDSLPTTHTHD